MGDRRVDEWLPVGWNVEVKIGKNGKRETYYVDPANGYMFRSIKDVDYCLITGKLGRNVVKPKQQGLGESHEITDLKLDINASPLKQRASKKKKEVSDGPNQEKKPSRRARKKLVADSRNTAKPGKSIQSSDDNIDSVTFFNGDSASGQEGRASPSYLSASAFGVLLGTQVPDYEAKPDEAMIPDWVPGAGSNGEFQILLQEAAGSESTFPQCSWQDDLYTTEAELFGTVDDIHCSDMLLESRDSESLFNALSAIDDLNRMVRLETRTVEDHGSPLGCLFGDLYSDPCIDFAVKTLTGTLYPAVEDCFPTQLGSTSASGSDLDGNGLQAEGTEVIVPQVELSDL